MKKILLGLSLLLGILYSEAQTIPKNESTDEFEYKQVIKVDNLSKAEIYQRAKN